MNSVDSFHDHSIWSDLCLIKLFPSLPPSSSPLITTFFFIWSFFIPLHQLSPLSSVHHLQKLKRLIPDEVGLSLLATSPVCLACWSVVLVFDKQTHHYPCKAVSVCSNNLICLNINVTSSVFYVLMFLCLMSMLWWNTLTGFNALHIVMPAYAWKWTMPNSFILTDYYLCRYVLVWHLTKVFLFSSGYEWKTVKDLASNNTDSLKQGRGEKISHCLQNWVLCSAPASVSCMLTLCGNVYKPNIPIPIHCLTLLKVSNYA